MAHCSRQRFLAAPSSDRRAAIRVGGILATLTFVVFSGCLEDPQSDPTIGPQLAYEPQVDAVAVEPSDLASPMRITQGKKGRLFVSDFLARRIVEFDVKHGELQVVQTFQLDDPPLGVAWAKNLLYVGNTATHSVDVYRASNGKWLYALGGQGYIGHPADIAVDGARGLIFVLDGAARVVKIFDLRRGVGLTAISGPGLGADQLQNPTALAVDVARHEVLVSDYGEPTESSAPPSIKIFDYFGTHRATISGAGGMLGDRFSRVQGLAVDQNGRILVAEALAGQVLVLDRQSGVVVDVLGSFGSGPGELWLPLDVVIDDNANVFVTNNRPRRIEVFNLGGQVQ